MNISAKVTEKLYIATLDPAPRKRNKKLNTQTETGKTKLEVLLLLY